ncbi:MAG: cyclic nucleotide-binding domain-containing protein [Desulfotalea sp.]
MKIDPDKQVVTLEITRLRMEQEERERKTIRLTEGVNAFWDGNLYLLFNKEVVGELLWLAKTNTTLQLELIDSLLAGLDASDKKIRERVLVILCPLLKDINLDNKNLDIKDILLKIGRWYQAEEVYFPILGTFTLWVTGAIVFLMKKKQFEVTAIFFAVVDRINRGILFKDQRIKKELALSLKMFATPENVLNLWILYYSNSEQKKIIASTLISFGYLSVRTLLTKLKSSGAEKEKDALIRFLPQFGKIIAPMLKENLANTTDGKQLSTIFRIYAEMEDATYFDDIKTYASHTDLIVQKEVVSAAVSMTGVKQAENLMELLPLLNSQLQNILLIEVLQLSDASNILPPISEYLYRNFESLVNEEELLITYCLVLEKIATTESAQILEKLKVESNTRPRLSRLKYFADRSLSVVSPLIRRRKHNLPIPKAPILNKDESAIAKAKLISDGVEKEISDTYSKATLAFKANLFYDKGLSLLEKQEYVSVLLIHDKLLKLDPANKDKYDTLLQKIEEYTNPRVVLLNSIEPILRAYFSNSECQELVKIMRKEKYKEGEYLIEQGDFNPCLFFLLEGELQVYSQEDEKSIFLKKLMVGESFGHLSMLNTGLVTESVLTSCESTVLTLQVDDFQELVNVHPALNERMLRFCRSYHRIPSYIKMSGSERRQSQRFNIKKEIDVVWGLGYSSLHIDTKSYLVDLSSSGASITIPKKMLKNIHILLDSEISLHITSELEAAGQVVAIRDYANNYDLSTVHISFLTRIPQEQLSLLLKK